MTTQQGVSTWAIDPVHSTAEFAVRHMMISTVKGRFGKLEGALTIDEANLANSRAETTIDATSIDTQNDDRDNHLRSPDFFDVATYPTLRFASKRVEQKSGDAYRVIGDLTIRDVTREVALETTIDGRITDPWGKERMGLSAETKINRKDWGLQWNMALEAGGFMVGDEAKVTIHLEAVKQD